MGGWGAFCPILLIGQVMASPLMERLGKPRKIPSPDSESGCYAETSPCSQCCDLSNTSQVSHFAEVV